MVDVVGKEQFDKILNESKGKLLFVDFWASWCGPCKMLSPLLDKLLEEDPENIGIVKINLEEEENQELWQEFWITGIPYVALYKDGTKVDEFSWAMPYEYLKMYVEKYV